LLYGAITELFQFALLPEREGSIFDFLANAFGTIFGVLFFRYFIKPKLLRKIIN
jgi:VanZ family protein